MPSKQFRVFLSAFSLSVSVGAAEAPTTKEPIIIAQPVERGSQIEKELMEARSVKADAPVQLSADAEVRKTLIKGDRPSVRFLLKKQATKPKSGGYGLLNHTVDKHPAPEYPQHQNKLENDKIKPPHQFEIEYILGADADVRFLFSTLEGVVVGKTEFAAGEVGARNGLNRRIIWDGRDAAGKEAPLGEYIVTQEIEYGKETIERRVFSLIK